MQAARTVFNNNGEKRGKLMRTSACFRGKLKNPPPPNLSSKNKKNTGQGWLKGTIGMEAPDNGLLAVPYRTISCQSSEIVSF